MFRKLSLSLPALAAAVSFGSASPVVADAPGAIFGTALGIMLGAAASQSRPRVVVTPRPSGSGVSSQQREANRLMQTHLNHFSFNAGVPDGVVGRNTRAAISAFQAFIGMPADGTITPMQRDILRDAYARALAPDARTQRLIARNGPRAVLLDQRDIALGRATRPAVAGYLGLPPAVAAAVDEIADSSDPSAEQLLERSGFLQLADLNGDGNTDYILDTSASGSMFWCGAERCKVLVFVSTPAGYARNDMLLADPTPASFDCVGGTCTVAEPAITIVAAPPPTAPAMHETLPLTTQASAGALPLFPTAPRTPSLSSHCTKVALLTSSNGGFATVADTGDPTLVLTEQFCLARGYAIDEAERAVAGLVGLTDAQIEAQCKVYGDALADHVAELGTLPRAQVLRNVSGFVLQSNADPVQLAAAARICLGTGYRIDDLSVAQGTALLLVALGEAPYGELLGHHLALGFGTTEETDRAIEWYGAALDALGNGAEPVFVAGLAERPAMLRAAVLGLDPSAIPAPKSASAPLPLFTGGTD